MLPTNLCPLIKSSFGYIISNSCSFYADADMIVAETTCDGKKKMFELIADRKPMHLLELTQKVNEKEAFIHWRAEVQKLRVALEEHYKRDITDDGLSAAINLMNRERTLLRRAHMLGARRPSIVMGLELSELRYRLAGVPGHIEMLEAFIAEAEGRQPVRAGHARRVLLTGCPTAQGVTKIIEVIESAGAVVVAQETCSGLKPLDKIVAETGDPIDAIARKYFQLPCSCMTPNTGRLELIGRLAEEFRADAVVDLIWQSCHTYNVEAWLVERFVRDRLGLQYLKVETDYSESDRERIGVRVQTLIEMLG